MSTQTITLQLEPTDYEHLANEARRLGTTPGHLAQSYVRAGLADRRVADVEQGREAGRVALKGLAAVRARLPQTGPIDIAQLLREGRDELERRTVQ